MKGMFQSGDFEHALDAKGRVTLPASYRDYFRDGVVLARFPDREPCISVFHPEAWSEFDEKHFEALDFYGSEADRWALRDIYKNRSHMDLDVQGRVLLPAQWIKDLGLSGKVKIVGARTHLEIWNPDTYAAEDQKRLGGGHA